MAADTAQAASIIPREVLFAGILPGLTVAAAWIAAWLLSRRAGKKSAGTRPEHPSAGPLPGLVITFGFTAAFAVAEFAVRTPRSLGDALWPESAPERALGLMILAGLLGGVCAALPRRLGFVLQPLAGGAWAALAAWWILRPVTDAQMDAEYAQLSSHGALAIAAALGGMAVLALAHAQHGLARSARLTGPLTLLAVGAAAIPTFFLAGSAASAMLSGSLVAAAVASAVGVFLARRVNVGVGLPLAVLGMVLPLAVGTVAYGAHVRPLPLVLLLLALAAVGIGGCTAVARCKTRRSVASVLAAIALAAAAALSVLQIDRADKQASGNDDEPSAADLGY